MLRTTVSLFRIGISVSGSCHNFYRSRIAVLFLFIVSPCGDGIQPEGRLHVAWGTCYSASDRLLRLLCNESIGDPTCCASSAQSFSPSCMPSQSREEGMVNEIVATAMPLAGGCHGKRAVLHSGNSTKELAAKLVKLGLSKDGLPTVAGGCWKYEQFTNWQRKRIRHEQAHARPPKSMSRANTSEANVAAAEEKPAEPTGTRIKERKRMLNIIHSRQKRERRRAEMEKLQEECEILREKNENDRSDDARLEASLRDATTKVFAIEQRLTTSGNIGGGQGTFNSTERVVVPPADLNVGGGLPLDVQLLALQQLQQQSSSITERELVQQVMLAERLNQEQALR